jgi:primosomal protein N' (replication factor Y)
VRAPIPLGPELARALRDAAAVRSARRDTGVVRIQVDPRDLG